MELRFRKKPVVIEAFQMTTERRFSNSDWPNWLHQAWQLDSETPGSLYPTEEGTCDGTLSIGTLEGQHLVSWGDWIIQGVQGELYPCKPDIFAKTYEPVEASPASVPEGFEHDIGADRFTVVQWSYWWHVRAGDGTQNIGKFHIKGAAEDMALILLTAFRDGAFMQYQAMLAAAPTPSVSEDQKDAERFREGWTHACNALCMEIALWIERCPHCGMPAPKAPAMQEDKP